MHDSHMLDNRSVVVLLRSFVVALYCGCL